jgi:hypothetical protein
MISAADKGAAEGIRRALAVLLAEVEAARRLGLTVEFTEPVTLVGIDGPNRQLLDVKITREIR